MLSTKFKRTAERCKIGSAGLFGLSVCACLGGKTCFVVYMNGKDTNKQAHTLDEVQGALYIFIFIIILLSFFFWTSV